jgi:hypothetical protein
MSKISIEQLLSGMPEAHDAMKKIIASAERVQQQTAELAENQQYMADNGQSSAIPGRVIEKSKKQSAKSKVETLQCR